MKVKRKRWFIPASEINRMCRIDQNSGFQKDGRTLALWSKNTMKTYLWFNCVPLQTHYAYEGWRGKVPDYFRNVIKPMDNLPTPQQPI